MKEATFSMYPGVASGKKTITGLRVDYTELKRYFPSLHKYHTRIYCTNWLKFEVISPKKLKAILLHSHGITTEK